MRSKVPMPGKLSRNPKSKRLEIKSKPGQGAKFRTGQREKVKAGGVWVYLMFLQREAGGLGVQSGALGGWKTL